MGEVSTEGDNKGSDSEPGVGGMTSKAGVKVVFLGGENPHPVWEGVPHGMMWASSVGDFRSKSMLFRTRVSLESVLEGALGTGPASRSPSGSDFRNSTDASKVTSAKLVV